jgi:hypothetical protein
MDTKARDTARVLGGTTVAAGAVAAFVAQGMHGMLSSPPPYWPIFEWGGGWVLPIAVIISGLTAFLLSYGAHRYRMLGMGFAGVLLALLAICGQMWPVREVFVRALGVP